MSQRKLKTSGLQMFALFFVSVSVSILCQCIDKLTDMDTLTDRLKKAKKLTVLVQCNSCSHLNSDRIWHLRIERDELERPCVRPERPSSPKTREHK